MNSEPESEDEDAERETDEQRVPLEGWPGSPWHLRLLDELWCR